MDAIEEQERPGYYAVIPADVRYDQSIPPNAKLLYGEISALIGKDGFCYASNSYFASLYGCTELTITRLISSLVKAGYIIRQVVKDNTGKIVLRKLWLKVSVPEILPPIKKDSTPYQKTQKGTIKNDGYINTSNTDIKATPEKKPKPSLTDEQIKETCIAWIKQHGTAWSNDSKNLLYSALICFYAPRATKKETPRRTEAAFTALTNKLLRYSAGQDGPNPLDMVEMLERATLGGWKCVYPLNNKKTVEVPQKEDGEKWL